MKLSMDAVNLLAAIQRLSVMLETLGVAREWETWEAVFLEVRKKHDELGEWYLKENKHEREQESQGERETSGSGSAGDEPRGKAQRQKAGKGR